MMWSISSLDDTQTHLQLAHLYPYDNATRWRLAVHVAPRSRTVEPAFASSVLSLAVLIGLSLGLSVFISPYVVC